MLLVVVLRDVSCVACSCSLMSAIFQRDCSPYGSVYLPVPDGWRRYVRSFLLLQTYFSFKFLFCMMYFTSLTTGLLLARLDAQLPK